MKSAIDKKTAKEMVVKFIKEHKELDKRYDEISEIFDISPECAFFSTVFAISDSYLDLISKTIGDDSEFLAWFIYDNDYGKKGLGATINGKKKKIKNVDDLMWAIYCDNVDDLMWAIYCDKEEE